MAFQNLYAKSIDEALGLALCGFILIIFLIFGDIIAIVLISVYVNWIIGVSILGGEILILICAVIYRKLSHNSDEKEKITQLEIDNV